MPLVIGTDEAGYAPNLGPLVICATAWQIPWRDFDFYLELAEEIHSQVMHDDRRLVIADSKTAYRSGGSIERLEVAVLALLATNTIKPQRISDLVNEICGMGVSLPAWYEWTDDRLPSVAAECEIDRQSERLMEGFARKSLKLLRIAARLVFPHEFNELIERHGNKAAVLSMMTLQLIEKLLEATDEDCLIICDRHGGRARYAPLVQQFLAVQWLEVKEETSNCSRYVWSNDEREFEIRFQVHGEAFLPTAAASMTAKYLRELMMDGWNRFWVRHDADLRPTAGYPLDAKRFLHDLQPTLHRLGIDRQSIWRCR